MVKWGDVTGCYFKKDVIAEVDYLVLKNQDIYSSRNQFLRSAVARLIRVETFILPLNNPEREQARSNLLKVEVLENGSNTNKKTGQGSDNGVRKSRQAD